MTIPHHSDVRQGTWTMKGGSRVFEGALTQHIKAARCLEARVNEWRPETFRFEHGTADPLALRRTRGCCKRGSKADHREDNWHRRALIANWVSVEDREPPLGAHLATPRLGYLHHGIYVGRGYVVSNSTAVRSEPQPVPRIANKRHPDLQPPSS
jgi:hypothetical protein